MLIRRTVDGSAHSTTTETEKEEKAEDQEEKIVTDELAKLWNEIVMQLAPPMPQTSTATDTTNIECIFSVTSAAIVSTATVKTTACIVKMVGTLDERQES